MTDFGLESGVDMPLKAPYDFGHDCKLENGFTLRALRSLTLC